MRIDSLNVKYGNNSSRKSIVEIEEISQYKNKLTTHSSEYTGLIDSMFGLMIHF